MPAKGVQFLPVRYPSGAPSWFTSFMDSFIKDVLVNLDVRNATPGSGIEITGTPDSPATISSSEDIQQLKDENYVLAEASAFLANARVIEGENGVVSVTDAGPGGYLTISLVAGGIPYSKLGDLDELSVLGNPTDSFGPVTRISGSAQHDVLSVQLDGSDLVVQFGTITHESVSDFDEAAQDAVGGILTDSDTVDFTYDDATPAITADVLTQMSITSDSGGLKLSGDSSAPGANMVYGTNGAGAKGWQSAGGGGSSQPLPNKEWRAISGATPDPVGSSAFSAVGTGSSPAKSTGGGYIGYANTRRITSTTAANNVGSYRSSSTADECYLLTSSSTSASGFFIRIRFGTAVAVAGERFFCGLAPNSAISGTTDPSSLLNFIGVGKDGTDTNYQIMHNGTGTATKIDTGLAVASGKFFELILSAPQGGASCSYSLTDLDTGTSYTGTLSTNLPVADAPMNFQLYGSVGATSGTAVASDIEYVGLRYPL